MHEKLVNPDSRIFEAELIEFRSACRSNSPPNVAQIAEIIYLIGQASTLSDREKNWRLTTLLRSWNAKPVELRQLANSLLTVSPTIKNALLNVFPPAVRPLLFHPKTDSTAHSIETVGMENDGDSKRSEVPHTSERTSVPVPTIDPDSELRTVILLGGWDQHETNIKFLEEHNFGPLRAGTASERDNLFRGPACGIIVDGSWWQQFPESEHSLEVSKIASYSTFVFLRFGTEGLDSSVANKIQSLVAERRFRKPLSDELQLDRHARLIAADIVNLEEAARVLSTVNRCELRPDEIGDNLRLLLMAAVSKFVGLRHFVGGYEVERLNTSIVTGGRSDAKVFLLKPNDGGAPIVAKSGAVDRLNEEMERFKLFIGHRENWLRPELHIHQSAAAILFSLISDGDNANRPAPTLAKVMENLHYADVSSSSESMHCCADVLLAIRRAIGFISDLNSTAALANEIESKCWLNPGGLRTLHQKNIDFRIGGTANALDLPALAERAYSRVQNLVNKSVVHGDMHAKNLLVRDREPYLVDYEYAGPGHPCFDLCRLTSSLLFVHLRMTEGESQLANSFARLVVEGASFDDISTEFPWLVSSATGAISIECAVTSRLKCIELSQKFGGDEYDYFAVMFVIACQSLTMLEMQYGIIRSMLRALAPVIEVL